MVRVGGGWVSFHAFYCSRSLKLIVSRAMRESPRCLITFSFENQDTLSHYLEKHDPCRCRSGETHATFLLVTGRVEYEIKRFLRRYISIFVGLKGCRRVGNAINDENFVSDACFTQLRATRRRGDA